MSLHALPVNKEDYTSHAVLGGIVVLHLSPSICCGIRAASGTTCYTFLFYFFYFKSRLHSPCVMILVLSDLLGSRLFL